MLRKIVSIEEPLLIRKAIRGDARAFERLYRAHVGRVYAICIRLVVDPARAEELTQDAFVRAWERLTTYRGAAAFSSWLYRLTVNVVVESQRVEGRLRFREVSSDGMRSEEQDTGRGGIDDHGVPDPDPTERVDLERAIASLPEGARMAFVLHDVEGYQHDEIADMTGTSVGTSKAQLHRARRLMRQRLQR